MPYVLKDGPRRREKQSAQDLLVALALTGGRWQEVAQLTWRQVDFASGTIMLWAGKTQEERPVPMPGPAREVLRRRFEEPGRHATLIFPGRDGEARAKGSCQAILRAMQACELNTPEMVASTGARRSTACAHLRQLDTPRRG